MNFKKSLFFIQILLLSGAFGYWLSTVVRPVRVYAQTSSPIEYGGCHWRWEQCNNQCEDNYSIDGGGGCSCDGYYRCKDDCARAERLCTGAVLVKSASTGTSTDSSASSSSKKMFVTSSTYDGNLGGITGADAKCQSDSNKPSTGTYKALIVDGETRIACQTANCSGGASENQNWVLKPNTAYVRTDGTAIGTTNSAGIFASALTNAVSSSTSMVQFRSGMKLNSSPGWMPDPTANCSFFSSTSGTGVTGNAAGKEISGGGSSNFLYVNASSCSTAVNLLCVEQ